MTDSIDDRPFGSVRRIVTGHDQVGQSVIEADAPSPHVVHLNEAKSLIWVELWRTMGSPARIDDPDMCAEMQLRPSPGGTVLRMMQFPPEAELDGFVPTDVLEKSAFEHQDSSIHPSMHKTRTVDYAIVLKGEIWAIMEKGEALMRPGDVLVQRGTNHAWSNRSDEPCIIVFVLIDGQ